MKIQFGEIVNSLRHRFDQIEMISESNVSRSGDNFGQNKIYLLQKVFQMGRNHRADCVLQNCPKLDALGRNTHIHFEQLFRIKIYMWNSFSTLLAVAVCHLSNMFR